MLLMVGEVLPGCALPETVRDPNQTPLVYFITTEQFYFLYAEVKLILYAEVVVAGCGCRLGRP
jgi:hypothetical protein